MPMDSGTFVPTTNVWDVSEIYSADVNTPEFKELLVRLYQNINNIALALNIRDVGLYLTSSAIIGQLYFPNPALNSNSSSTPSLRQVLRKVINFGPLPDTGTTPVAHGIIVNSSFTFTRIYACASDTTGFNYIPIPYASPTLLTNNIELRVDATFVYITTGSNRSNFNITYVVLEYLTN